MLGNLALLPLRHLSLADTGVTDEGIGQLLAMSSLRHLDLRNSAVGDGCLGVLLQLPLLGWLDLSGTEFTGGCGGGGGQVAFWMVHTGMGGRWESRAWRWLYTLPPGTKGRLPILGERYPAF